jgi:hypothetical protein
LGSCCWRQLSVFSGSDVGIAFMPCFVSHRRQASRSTWICRSAMQTEMARFFASYLCGLVTSKTESTYRRLYQDRTVAFFSKITWNKRSVHRLDAARLMSVSPAHCSLQKKWNGARGLRDIRRFSCPMSNAKSNPAIGVQRDCACTRWRQKHS